MLLLVTASLILAGLGAALGLKLRACRNVSSTRSVLLHVPIETAWDLVSDFPALFAAHGHGRSLLRVTTTALERGDGRAAGSVWVQGGTWEDRPYSARIEILEIEAPFLLAVRLLGDNLGSERGLLDHRGELRLRPGSEGSTKVTWRLSARLGGLRNLFARLLAPESVDARLLDLSLRSLKGAIDGGTRQAGAGDPVSAPPLLAEGPLSAIAAPIPGPTRSPQPR